MNLKTLRKKMNLKQSDIARSLKISDKTYGNYENSVTDPNITTLIKLADYFHVSIDELVGREFNIQINEQEQKLLDLVRQLSPIEQGKIIGYAESRLEYNKQQKEKLIYKKLKDED